MRGLEKNYMKRGHQTDRQTDRKKDKLTSQLLDQLGPEGRVGENPSSLTSKAGRGTGYAECPLLDYYQFC